VPRTAPVADRYLRPRWRAAGAPPPPFDRPPASRTQWLGFATLSPHGWRNDPVDRWAIDWRDPTADRRLLERMLTFPLAAFAAAGRERGLARAIGEGLLPDSVRLRASRGEQAPERAASIGRSAPAYRAALDKLAASPAAREILDLPAIEASLAGFATGTGVSSAASAWLQAMTLGLFIAQQEEAG
jgi:asparagine synthase (glutamine-hydrolysing)